MAHAAGLQNQREIWAHSALLRKQDRALNAKALGVEESLGDNEEMPGDINIKGDEHITQHIYNTPAPAQSTGTAAVATAAKSGLGKWLLPAVMTVALPAAGAAVPLLWQYFHQSPPAAVVQPEPQGGWDVVPGISVSDTP